MSLIRFLEFSAAILELHDNVWVGVIWQVILTDNEQ